MSPIFDPLPPKNRGIGIGSRNQDISILGTFFSSASYHRLLNAEGL